MTMDILVEVALELNKAEAKHKPMASRHDAYATILEEVDEFWDEVKKREPSPAAMKEELIQIAAMAVRAVKDLKL